MKTRFSSLALWIVFGLLEFSGDGAWGQEGIVSWNSTRNAAGYPVMRTDRELVPNERIEIEVVKGLQGLEIGVSRPGELWHKKWQPNETKEGSTLSFIMTKKFQVSLGVWKGLKYPEETSVTNAKDSTSLSYDSGLVVLRVKVISPDGQANQPTSGPKPSPEDDKPAPPRWERADAKDGKPSIQTKESPWGRKITLKAEKVVATRYVSLGFRYPEQSRPDYFPTLARTLGVSDKPMECIIPREALYLGVIQIGRDPRAPEVPEVQSFKGYDKLTMKDGSVYIVKIAK
jgi:hypothetical protein